MRVLLVCVFTVIQLLVLAQDAKPFAIYKPEENAKRAIQTALSKAGKENKHVLIQVGGNWCSWCAKFYTFTKSEPSIDSLLQSSFVVYHLNYSKENENLSILAQYAFPQRFGFPVFLILDGKGRLLHTQNSSYLENDKGYSKEKVFDFLQAWTTDAINPKNYKTE